MKKPLSVLISLLFLAALSIIEVQAAGDIPTILGSDWQPERGSKLDRTMGATCTSDDGGSTCTCAGGCWGNESNCGCTLGKGIPLKSKKQTQSLSQSLKKGDFKVKGNQLVVGDKKLRAYKKQGYLAPGMQPPIKSATCTSGDGKSTCECTGFCKAGQTTCRCGHKDTLQKGWGDGLQVEGVGGR